MNCSHTTLGFLPPSDAFVTTLWKSLTCQSLVLDLDIVVFADLRSSTFPFISPNLLLALLPLLVTDRLVFCLILFVICFGIDVFENLVIVNNLIR